MDNLQVSADILPEDVGKELSEKQKMTQFFRVINTDSGKRFEVNIPSIGSFRMNWFELIIALFLLKRILRL